MDVSRGAVGPPLALSRQITTDRRLLSSASATVVSRLAARLVQLAFVVVAARLLGVPDFAAYSYLFVLITACVALGDCGVAMVTARDVSSGRVGLRRAFWPALYVAVANAVVASLLTLALGAVDSGPGSSGGPLVLASAYVGVNMLVNFKSTTLRAIGSFRLEAWLQLAAAVAFVLAATLAAVGNLGVVGIFGVLLAKEVALAVAIFAALRRHTGTPLPASLRAGARLLRRGLRLALASTALVVLARASLLVLGNVGSTDDVAWFSASVRFADAALVLSTTAGFALLPGLSYLVASDARRAARLVRRVVAIGFVASAVVAAAAVVAADPIVETLFGPDFSGAIPPARILLLGLPSYTVLGLVWYALLGFELERELVRLAGALALISLIVAAALAYPFGAVGAAVAHVVSLSLCAGAGLLLLVRRARW
jgi:O-antigen/teichoic acid export membrane protein